MENEFNVQDGSNDRNYFTIIPNYILNHSTSTAQSLYLQLKRLAGENGIAYPSQKYLTEKMSISKNTLKKEFNYLLTKGWIEFAGDIECQTAGGLQKMKSYRIVDLWHLNTVHYQGGSKQTPLKVKGGSKQTLEGGQNVTTNKNHIKEELIPETSSESFSFSEYIKEMRKSEDARMRLIAVYFTRRGLTFSTKGEIGVAIKRHLRAATDVTKFEKDKVNNALNYCKDKYGDIDWTLDTVKKVLTGANL